MSHILDPIKLGAKTYHRLVILFDEISLNYNSSGELPEEYYNLPYNHRSIFHKYHNTYNFDYYSKLGITAFSTKEEELEFVKEKKNKFLLQTIKNRKLNIRNSILSIAGWLSVGSIFLFAYLFIEILGMGGKDSSFGILFVSCMLAGGVYEGLHRCIQFIYMKTL